MADQSIREQILQAVMTAVGPAAATLGATAERRSSLAITPEKFPALVVYPESEEIERRANDRIDWLLVIRVAGLARAVVPDHSEAIGDQLVTAAHAALMRDVTLGGLALGIAMHPVDFPRPEEADGSFALIPRNYAIRYRTLLHDLTAQG